MPTRDRSWFVKSRRAKSSDDYETWIAGGVSPTLNAFDNANENRATVVVPIQDGREVEKKQNGLGVGKEGDPACTLDTESAQAVAYNIHSGSKRQDRPSGGMYVQQSDLSRTLDASGGLNPAKNDGGLAIVEQAAGFKPVASSDARSIGYEEGLSPTLEGGAGGNNKPAVLASTVRRLTPKECERLQGFPDDWTAARYDFKKGEVVAQADSARYKQMGNAVAVPVFEWVMRRLVEVALRDNTAR